MRASSRKAVSKLDTLSQSCERHSVTCTLQDTVGLGRRKTFPNGHPVKEQTMATTSSDLRDMRDMGQKASRQPAVLALSNNESMLDILRRAVPNGSSLVEVTNASQLNEKCLATKPGILVVDHAMGIDIQRTTIQLMQDLPELVVVMVGKSEESDTLKKLAAAGQIYRFMLVPLAHGQTKLTLEAAMKQHTELSDATSRRVSNAAEDDNDKPVKNYLPIYLGLGAALIVVVGGAFFGLSRMGQNQEAPAVSSTQNDSAASKELALADAALAAGKLLEPPGESALDLYRTALSIDPKSERAKAGIDNVGNKILGQVETALTSQKLDVAVAALEQAREVAPENPRLKFYDTQIANQRELLKLTQAQDTGKKIRGFLAEAQDDMDAGRLVTPAGNSAREAIAEARKLDPTDPAVAQAQRNLNNRLIDAARRAAEQGQGEQAQTYIAAARQMGSVGADLGTIERSISDARNKASADAQAAAQRAAAAQQQAEAAQKAAAEAAAAQQAKAAAAQAPQAPAVVDSPLKRTKTVSPVFPPEAEKRGLTGWVQVSFTVQTNGAVDNVRVTDADPKNVFDFAAMQAVEQWRFEPPLTNGKAAPRQTSVRLNFRNK